MKLTIFAATGGIGRHLLEQAVDAGHDVTAVVRDPAKLPRRGGQVRVVTADLASADPQVLASAVAGQDAVLSGLGPRKPRSQAGITSRGTAAIVAAMQATGVRRLVVVSAAPIGTVPSPGRPNPPKHDPGDGFFMRHLGSRFARTLFSAHYADLALTEDIVRASGLDWTISRPPQLTEKPLTGDYRTAYGRNIRGGTKAARADVAHHMLRILDEPDSIGQTVGIAN
ncbi:NAD(P)-dependent oxidoreductase [Streptomyces sp. NPDC058299]|uniref:NAD(P)-dependent oxidoreductase n=1 Tax=unclassified Streptomyces TaxID=2593676 RepID=UPI0036E74DE5